MYKYRAVALVADFIFLLRDAVENGNWTDWKLNETAEGVKVVEIKEEGTYIIK